MSTQVSSSPMTVEHEHDRSIDQINEFLETFYLSHEEYSEAFPSHIDDKYEEDLYELYRDPEAQQQSGEAKNPPMTSLYLEQSKTDSETEPKVDKKGVGCEA